ncbi:PREDICTED: trypsin 5G1-like [Ceratosolen solmsi marchali]|uniref:Trypsin 5G1-like n=1 Tax=Ceratosolen solmsi marchali TaxID=326594 RepID=A0AAJ6YP08_9HYME|nr:PREDICTED: trypsin 5G1-like [Ceratosolen solmsi marchali]
MVSLQHNGTFFGHDYDHFCCGIIIKQKWIITSAQCALARKVNEFHVRVGSSKYYENGAIYNIKNIAIHPNYNNIILDYDVALLELTKSIVFDKNTMPIDIPENNEIIQDKTNISIAGWGATQLLGKISDDLRESHVQKISNEACQLYYGNNSVTDRMFCIFTEGSGPCVGDSGSPATVLREKGKREEEVMGTYACE